MRVNIEQKATSDLRFRRLSRVLGMEWFSALGAFNYLWDLAQKNECDLLMVDDVEEFLGVQNFCAAAVAAELMEDVGSKTVRLKGMRERLDEIEKYKSEQSLKAKKRWGKQSTENSRSNAAAMPEQCRSNASRPDATAMPEQRLETGCRGNAPMSMSMSMSKETPNGVSIKNTDPSTDVAGSELIECEVVEQKKTRTKKPKNITEHDIDLGTRWFEWTKNFLPNIKATPESFSEAIFQLKKTFDTETAGGDVNGFSEAVFAFIKEDTFWCARAFSPASLLKLSANGLRKIDNIVTSMRRNHFQHKRIALDYEEQKKLANESGIEEEDWAKEFYTKPKQ